MHTASVLALAGLLATVGRRLDAARLYPILTAVAGVLVAGVGVRLVVRRGLAARAAASAGHHHDHEHHDHHEHSDAAAVLTPLGGGSVAVLDRPATRAHAPGHTHHRGPGGHTHDLPPDVRPLSAAGLVALGTSGGLFPSPSAVVVLVGSFALGRAALGLAMIAAFSLGLGAMLVTVGVLLVAGRNRLARSRFYLQLPWLPTVGAVAIVVLGAVLIVQGVAQLP
jgi:ABC-type nickel/cobalt efflux system permease component RcnA